VTAVESSWLAIVRRKVHNSAAASIYRWSDFRRMYAYKADPDCRDRKSESPEIINDHRQQKQQSPSTAKNDFEDSNELKSALLTVS